MRTGSYLLIVCAVAVCVATALVLSRRRATIAVCVVAAILVGLGLYAWLLDPHHETPLISYLMAALVPTGASAVVVRRCERRSISTLSTWSFAALTFALAFFPVVFISYYFLAPHLPSVLGCCPL